jgi:hypothetical protein
LRTPRGRSDGAESPAAAVTAAGEQLLYDAGERIVLPERLADRFCILIDGQLAQINPDGESFEGAQRRLRVGSDGDLSRAASLARIERALAARIGPYAGPLVARASANGASLAAICTGVAQEIDDPQQREGFLSEASPPAQQTRGPGFLFRCQRDPAQRLAPHPPLRAIDYALLLVAPESALTTAGQAADTRTS